MKIGVPREIHPGEKRVAATPEVAARMIKLGYGIVVERGAGAAAYFSDEAYREAGAEIADDPRTLWREADIVLKVRAPEHHPELALDEVELLAPGKTLIGFIWPAQHPELMERMAAKGATVLAMDSIPRISRAQKMDALSSMSNIAGYRAVIEAAEHFGRFFAGQITAAGKIPPARVLVIGAGVAGLAAIGVADSMGAIVRAFDTRPEVKEQVESMNAEFLELAFEEQAGSTAGGYAKVMSKEFIEAEMKLFAEQAREVDIIITTALIPGKPAPELITKEMVKSMRPGSVIVDLAAEQGGNCKLTEPGKVAVKHGVTLVGYTDLPSRMAAQSSQLYGTNLYHLLSDLTPEKNGAIVVDMEDEVIRGATVIKEGKITWPPPPVEKKPAAGRGWWSLGALALGTALLLAVGAVAPPAFMAHFIVFVLAIFVGWQVVWNVTPALHTPLMSVTNAISGIIIIGAMLQTGSPSAVVVTLAGVAALIASINIAGGFLVTQRMLKMFRREEG